MTRLRSPSASTPPCVSAIDAAADRIREETGLHTHAERRKLEWAADKQLGGTVILVSTERGAIGKPLTLPRGGGGGRVGDGDGSGRR